MRGVYMVTNDATDIGYWQAKFIKGEISWNKLRFITYNKFNLKDIRPRFFKDETGWENRLEGLRLNH